MLKIKIIVVDRTRATFLREGEAFYLKRLKRYARVDWVEVKPVRIRKGMNERQVLETEGRNIEKMLLAGDYVVSLDRSGRQYGSRELADRFNELSMSERGWFSFVIGGPLGLSKEVIQRADMVMSLSKMTMTHEMSRLILLEQLYRAMTILRGESYHK